MAEQAFQMFAVDSPRTFRTIRIQLQERQRDLLAELVNVIDWNGHMRVIGALGEINITLAMLDEIEGQERN